MNALDARHAGGRLALFLPNMSGGGAERVMLNIASGLADKGYGVDLVLARAEGPYLKQIPQSVRLIDLRSPGTMASLPALTAYLRRERPVTLLTALERANVVAIWARNLARARVRLVLTIHNTLSISFKNARGLRARMMPFYVKKFYPKADAIVCVSRGSARDLAEMTHIDPKRLQVIYNPIVTPELLRSVHTPVDHPWMQPGQPPVILAVGRLTGQKDYATLLRAFALIVDRSQARLIILGEGEDRPQLEALAAQLGILDRMQMPGFVDNSKAYMARARLLALSSIFEGLPTVLIEALAVGTPIVSTNCPSGADEILASGKYGALVPVRDPQSLAEAIVAELSREKRAPDEEAWMPFLHDKVIGEYIKVMLPTAN